MTLERTSNADGLDDDKSRKAEELGVKGEDLLMASRNWDHEAGILSGINRFIVPYKLQE